MFTIDTFVTESGSTYTVSGAFGATFVTRSSDHDIEALDGPSRDETVPCDSVERHIRWSPSRGAYVDALLIKGGPWDRVITSPIDPWRVPLQVG